MNKIYLDFKSKKYNKIIAININTNKKLEFDNAKDCSININVSISNINKCCKQNQKSKYIKYYRNGYLIYYKN